MPKILLKWIIVIITGIIIILFLIFGFPSHEVYVSTSSLMGNLINSNSIQSLVSEEKITSGVPVRFRIPNINIDANVESVGVTSEGVLDIPKDYSNVAWFNLGPRPGEIGSAVIDGHSGRKDGIPSVFDGLNKIKKGDKLYVEDEKGVIVTFIVRDFRTYAPKEDTASIFTSNDGKAHLNLITCIGAWYVNQKSPNDRFVVFADKE